MKCWRQVHVLGQWPILKAVKNVVSLDVFRFGPGRLGSQERTRSRGRKINMPLSSWRPRRFLPKRNVISEGLIQMLAMFLQLQVLLVACILQAMQ